MTRPNWIRSRIMFGNSSERFRSVLADFALNTVCVEADCPNKGECWDSGNVTFIILGDTCTRDCRFCNVKKGSPEKPDPGEPKKIAEAVKKLGIRYAVLTSVTRDDLQDAGSGHFVSTVASIKEICPDVPIEILIPDFFANTELLKKVLSSGAGVIGHNIEMPENLYPVLRPKADYGRSLDVLEKPCSLRGFNSKILIKSSIMLGLGETESDVLVTLRDLKVTGTDIVYIGQYLSPSGGHWPVKKYYTPEEFSRFEEVCIDLGFRAVLSGPMVRSSYRAYETYLALMR